MVDETLKLLLEAVREIANDTRNLSECACGEQWGLGHMESCMWKKYAKLTDKLDAHIKLRHGRSDDVPAEKVK